MFPLWIVLTLSSALGLILFISDRLLNQSLAHEGICPVCGGEGGPCDTCNGFGIIIDAKTTAQSPPRQSSNSATETEKIEN